MFTITLFTIAKIWKQLKCPLAFECTNKLFRHYIYI